MKGLLLKDFYMACKYCRAYLFMTLIFVAVSLVTPGDTYFLMYPCVFCSMMPITLLAYDERSKWDEFSAALPYSKAQIVTAKYLYGLLASGAVIVVLGAAHAMRMIISGSFDFSEFITLIVLFVLASVSAPALCMPFMFWLGVEKGRIAYYAVLILFVILLFLVSDLLRYKTLIQLNQHGLILSLVGSVILYAFSWYLSVRLYAKRQV